MASAAQAWAVPGLGHLAPMPPPPGLTKADVANFIEIYGNEELYVVHRGVALYGGHVRTAGSVWGEDMLIAAHHLIILWCNYPVGDNMGLVAAQAQLPGCNLVMMSTNGYVLEATTFLLYIRWFLTHHLQGHHWAYSRRQRPHEAEACAPRTTSAPHSIACRASSGQRNIWQPAGATASVRMQQGMMAQSAPSERAR